MVTISFLHFRLKTIELIKKGYLNLIISDVNFFILALNLRIVKNYCLIADIFKIETCFQPDSKQLSEHNRNPHNENSQNRNPHIM